MADTVRARFNVDVKGVSLTLPSHLLNSNDDCKWMTMIIFISAKINAINIIEDASLQTSEDWNNFI